MTMDSTRHLESEKTTLPWKRNWISKDFIAEEKLRLQHGGERTYEDESESEKINAYENQINRLSDEKCDWKKESWFERQSKNKSQIDLSLKWLFSPGLLGCFPDYSFRLSRNLISWCGGLKCWCSPNLRISSSSCFSLSRSFTHSLLFFFRKKIESKKIIIFDVQAG